MLKYRYACKYQPTNEPMNDLKTKANHKAWEIWQDARKTAASQENIVEWQRLNRATTALNAANPNYVQEGTN